jgi:hypothetical protein
VVESQPNSTIIEPKITVNNTDVVAYLFIKRAIPSLLFSYVMHLVLRYFRYDLLRTYLKNASITQAGFTLPDSFYIIDIKYV